MARDYTKREFQLLAEWCVRTFPGREIRYNVRLGAITSDLDMSKLTDAEIRALGVNRRYVDAIAFGDRELHLVEAKLRGVPGALEQLDLYARLLPLTPELANYKHWRIVRHLVWAIPDAVIEAMARERGILVHDYFPEWLQAYFKELRPRERVGTRSGGLLDQLTLGVSEEIGE